MIDEVSLRILWDRLVSVTNEASVVLKRSAFSTLVRDCNDFACSIMTPNGDTLAIADASLPSFSTTQSITLKAVLERFPLESWRPGDVVITNDPWIATGQIMDITLLKPTFHRDRLVAFTGSIAHSPDLGGLQRWNGAKDIYEEGLFIRPTKFYSEGMPNETLFQLLEWNSRMPEQTIGDLMAQLASHEVGERRLIQVMEEHDLDTLDELAYEIFARSERTIRAAIAEIPNGEYRFEMMADGSLGGPYDQVGERREPEPMAVRVKVTVADTSIEVDFSESSDQVEPPINSVFPFTYAYGAYAIRLLLVSHLPQNAGFLRPLRIVAKQGTVMNAAYPAATLNRGIVGHLVCDAIFGALSELLPARARAMSGSTPLWQLILIGEDDANRPYQRIMPLNGGLGATTGADGIVCSFPANLTTVPVEILELTTPIRWERKEILTDSAGPGTFRGGYGVRSVFRPLRRGLFSMTFSRVANPPKGFLGGGDGRAGHVVLNGTELRPGAEGVLHVGDELIVETPGGGGIGLPEQRPPDKIQSDLEAGVISEDHAVAMYGLQRGARSALDEQDDQ